MTLPLLIAAALRLAFLAFLVVAGVWAYRRFRLPPVPWLLGYVLLGAILALPAQRAAEVVMEGAAASGLGPIGSRMTIGKFLVFISVTSSALATAGQALGAWFVLAEVAFAYQRLTPADSIPAIVTVPRQHSAIVGLPLLACAAAMPMFWLGLWAARA